MSTKSFSYFELMNGKITLSKLEAVTNAGGLNEETLARIGHVGRFYQRIRTASPNPNFKISDVLTGDELQNSGTKPLTKESAVGQCPLVH